MMDAYDLMKTGAYLSRYLGSQLYQVSLNFVRLDCNFNLSAKMGKIHHRGFWWGFSFCARLYLGTWVCLLLRRFRAAR